MKALISIAIAAALMIGCGSDDTDDSNGTDNTDTTESTDQADVVDSGDDGTGGPADEGTPADDNTGSEGDAPIIGPPPDTHVPDTAVAVPPSTCRKAIDCWADCNNDTCKAACLEGADQAILDTMETVATCVNASGGCAQAPIQCLVEECFTEYSLCAFDGKFGEDKCSDMNECIVACGDDDACIGACFQGATVEAQKNYIKLQVCVKNYAKDNCEQLDEDCKKQAEQSAFCFTQYDFCLGDKS